MTLTEVQILIGVITGPLGLLLAAIVYFRDRASIVVSVTWGMTILGDKSNKKRFLVKVCNTGRRPVHVSHAHIILPRSAGPEYSHLVLTSGIDGVTLAEGSPPHVIPTDEDEIRDFAHVWWKLRATITDATGKQHHSDWPISAPAWAKDVAPPFGAITWNRLKNWGRQRVL